MKPWRNQDGVHLPTSTSRAAGGLEVRQAMRAAPSVVLSPDQEIGAALRYLTLSHSKDGPFDSWPVSGKDGLWGMVRGSELEQAAAAGPPRRKLSELLGASDAEHPPDAEHLPHLHPDHPLSVALERMGSGGLSSLPVVSRANVRELMGIVLLDDILVAYGVGRSARRAAVWCGARQK